MGHARGRPWLAIAGSFALIAMAAFFFNRATVEQTEQFPGVSATRVRLGHIAPYSGSLAVIGATGRVAKAYFDRVNAMGGILGRQIEVISLDDRYDPSQTRQAATQLIEDERVAFVFGSVGIRTNAAIRQVMNQQRIPHLFLLSGADMWNDPEHYPWTLAGTMSYRTEGSLYGQYVRESLPNSKVGVLYPRDSFGEDLRQGLFEGLGESAASTVVSQQSYDPNSASIAREVAALKASGATVWLDCSTTHFAVEALQTAHAIDWHPIHILNSSLSGAPSVLHAAGPKAAQGAVTVMFMKDVQDPQWEHDPGMQQFSDVTATYDTTARNDPWAAVGFTLAQMTEYVLRRCGNDLSRKHVLTQATHIQNLSLPLLLPGITLNTSPDNYHLIRQGQMARFDGSHWVLFGHLLGAKPVFSEPTGMKSAEAE